MERHADRTAVPRAMTSPASARLHRSEQRASLRAAPDGTLTTTTSALTSRRRTTASQPGLVFFHSGVSGRCRRVEGYLAQVLQHRRNHETFKLYRVASEEQPALLKRFKVDALPTLVVVEDKQVKARLERPRGCREIEDFLGPWLR